MLVLMNDNQILNSVDNTANRIRGQISKATNSIDTFTFSIFPPHEFYKEIKPFQSRIKIYDDNGDMIFEGRVFSIKPYMSDSGEIGKEVSCEGGLCYLCDSVPIYVSKTQTINEYLNTVINLHNKAVEDFQKINLGSVSCSPTATYTFTCEYESTFEDISRNLISNADIGGELRIRYSSGKRYLDYTTTEFTAASSKTIVLAKNLRAITQEINPENVVTRLYPLGAVINNDTGERLTLSGPVKYIDNEKLVEEYGIHAGTIIYDSITNSSALSFVATQDVAKLKTARVQYEISAVDIDSDIGSFAVGCNYRVTNALMGIDETLRCVGITLDINDKTENTLTVGDAFDTLSGITSSKISRIESQMKDITASNGLIRRVVNNQTALICGDLGGQMVYKRNSDGQPTDLFFIDTTDIATATQALRINRAGIGFWKKANGGTALSGTYDKAWTLDGTFNTDYILGKVIQGLAFNNGNGTFSVDSSGTVIAKALTMLGGTIKIETTDEKNSVIKLSYKEWTLELSPLQWVLKNSTIGGRVLCQAGGLYLYWNDELKVNISSNYGNIITYGGNKMSFLVNTNNRTVSVYDESNEKCAVYLDGNRHAVTLYPEGSSDRSIFLDGNSGTVYAKNFQKTT